MIVNFLDAVHVMGFLPPNRCPDFKESTPALLPTPTASQAPSVSTRPRPRAKKPEGLPADVIMGELAENSDDPEATPKDKRKGKGKEVERAVDVGSSSKRALQEDSPSQEETASKRSRTQERSIPDGMDFGELVVGEWTPISPEVFPEVEGKVRCPLDLIIGVELTSP